MSHPLHFRMEQEALVLMIFAMTRPWTGSSSQLGALGSWIWSIRRRSRSHRSPGSAPSTGSAAATMKGSHQSMRDVGSCVSTFPESAITHIVTEALRRAGG